MLYLVLMKQVQAFSQILSSSSSSASSCCSSGSPSFCSSADSPLCCGHKPNVGKYRRSHQTTRTDHFIFVTQKLKMKKKSEWTPSYPYFCRSPAAADTSVPGCTSARGWRAAGCTAAADTTSLIPRLQNAGRCWPLVKVYIAIKQICYHIYIVWFESTKRGVVFVTVCVCSFTADLEQQEAGQVTGVGGFFALEMS